VYYENNKMKILFVVECGNYQTRMVANFIAFPSFFNILVEY
jgi:hypothetical protein